MTTNRITPRNLSRSGLKLLSRTTSQTPWHPKHKSGWPKPPHRHGGETRVVKQTIRSRSLRPPNSSIFYHDGAHVGCYFPTRNRKIRYHDDAGADRNNQSDIG